MSTLNFRAYKKRIAGIERRKDGRNELQREEQEVPEDVNESMHDSGGEDRTGFAPCPAVEQTRYGGQQDVAPVGEMHVADVRKAEEDGGGDPADGFAFCGA